MTDTLTRWQLGAAAAGLALAIGWAGWALVFDPRVVFVVPDSDPAWITPVAAVNTQAVVVDRSEPSSYGFSFVRGLELEQVPERARLWMRAPGRVEARINERKVATGGHETGDPAHWKRGLEADVSGLLQPGANELRVRISHADGPPLLQLSLEARAADGSAERLLETGPDWIAIDPAGARLETTVARDTRPHPESFGMPGSGQLIVAHAVPLALLFALGAALAIAARQGSARALRDRAPELTLALCALAWGLVYVLKSGPLPLRMGFDIVGHLAYVDYLLEHGALPIATQGGSMYHPPLAHGLLATLAWTFGLGHEDPATGWLYRLPGLASGLAIVVASWATAHCLFRGDPLRTSLATAFAALLPMNVYMSAYVSNEPLHAALVSASLYLGCRMLCEGEQAAPRPIGLATVGACLGLAILTKFTALIAIPLVAGCVAARRRLIDGASAAAAATSGALVLCVAALVGGWFYLRSWLLLGRPVVGNWDLPGRLGWWEQPGFHTPDYYTSFGTALSRPFFAGYQSFWDGLYSTLWADGLVAGMARVATRHEAWNYDWMTLSAWLAFPATVLLVVGSVRAMRVCLRDSDRGRRLAMSLLVAFAAAGLFALLSITLRLPYYAQAKAFYLLSATVPLSIFAALGLAWPLERLGGRAAGLGVVYCGWLGTLSGAIALAFLG